MHDAYEAIKFSEKYCLFKENFSFQSRFINLKAVMQYILELIYVNTPSI